MKFHQSRPMKCPSRAATLLLIILPALIAAADLPAQTTAQNCPNHKALTLDQVDKLIEEHIPEERTLQLIQACHVDFSMDPPTIEHLVSSGASERILDTLNLITSTNLNLDHAKTEVALLEQKAQQRRKSVEAERDAALHQLDDAYQAQRSQITQITPQGQFEPDRDYVQRKKQSESAAAALESRHKADRAQLEDSFNQQAELRAQPYLSRIQFLKHLSYPDPVTLVYSKYNPNTGLLEATLGSDTYQFEQVPPKSAETLYKNWKQASLHQPFEETARHERTLTLGDISISGFSLKAQEAIRDQLKQYEIANTIYKHIRDARSYLVQRRVEDAQKEYQAVLKLDTTNPEAHQEITAIQAYLKSLSDLRDKQKNEGVWADEKQGRMWPLHDNGADINWKSAGDYCRNLRTGGFSDWRLPYKVDLESVYSNNSTQMTTPHSHTRLDILTTTNGQIAHKDRVPAKPYHIRGNIQLTEVLLWTFQPAPLRGQYLLADFSQGHYAQDLPNSKEDYRVLCVRSYRPAGETLAGVPAPTTPLIEPVRPADAL